MENNMPLLEDVFMLIQDKHLVLNNRLTHKN